ncbi:hypothetical protein IWW45_008915 [Coemansia sp. RSA 485]|nr:hypothetical protein IWW45_008915 [Coemansia sp. RSA 485]
MHFARMLGTLGLQSSYAASEADCQRIIDGILVKVASKHDNRSYNPVIRMKDVKEAALVEKFQLFVACCSNISEQEHPLVGCLKEYRFENHETRNVLGTSAKPDGVFYYQNHITETFSNIHVIVEAKKQPCGIRISNQSLGQMTHYAQMVWESQPTRLFVPAIFLNGALMDVLLFARSGYWRVSLGSFACDTAKNYMAARRTLLDSLSRLFFLLCQPSEKFGHFVDASSIPCFLKFGGTKSDSSVSVANTPGDDCVSIESRIGREVPAHRRAAFLFDTEYGSARAVLKLSWTPVSRQPEGALYDILHAGNVECIPKIFKSGILISNFLGYRLEYILMEHCGRPVLDVFKSESETDNCEKTLVRLASDVSSKICACLLQAEKAGVYHRDISAGNITVDQNGSVYLIDWGYGKALHTVSDRVKSNVKNDWAIDLDKLTRNEDARDGMTGTMYYMGIRVLMGNSNRSIFEDLESLLYVILGVLSCVSTGRFAADAPGFEISSNLKSAYAKAGIMSDPSNFGICFGASLSHCGYGYLVRKLYSLVFEQENNYIGFLLLRKQPETRTMNHRLLKEIMGDNLYGRCFPSQTTTVDSSSSNDMAAQGQEQGQGQVEAAAEERSGSLLATQTVVLVPMPIAEPERAPATMATPLSIPVASKFTIHCPIPTSGADRFLAVSGDKCSSPISPTPIINRGSSALASGMVLLNVSSSLPQTSDSRKRKADREYDAASRASKSKRTDSNASLESSRENNDPASNT